MAVTGACTTVLPISAVSATSLAVQTGQLTTLSFDELPFQSVDGLTAFGVTFEFKIDGADSAEAFYNSFGPGSLTFVDDPSLTGDARGVLTLDFAEPVPVLEFGVALNTGQSLESGVIIHLIREDNQTINVEELATSAGDVLGFSESEFRYAGTPVSTAIIQFASGPSSFALDNLTFGVPEPTTSLLSVIALALLPGIVRPERSN